MRNVKRGCEIQARDVAFVEDEVYLLRISRLWGKPSDKSSI